ncbi:TlpA disulfide reductase family protein [Kitasatospora cinereorecta]|uniref:TlpA family protein disulfide reductase n=1 Tax=Kitasatospora cinereorecta TaxID=285560 RepID=A0ABW0VFU5_9ACTN
MPLAPPDVLAGPARWAAAAAAALALAGCSAAAPGSTASRNAAPSARTFPIAERRAAPDLTGHDLDGAALRLADQRGHVVVVNIWGSWCGPCRAEASGLQRVHADTEASGVRFLGIDTRDPDPGPARTFVRDHGLSYPSLFDPKGALVRTLPPDVVNAQALPATLVLDRQGRIAAGVMAPLTPEELHALLDPVLAEEPA